MANDEQRRAEHGGHPPVPGQDEGPANSPPAADPRKPYEAPRLLKKRSVARATLFTAMGPTASMLTGNG